MSASSRSFTVAEVDRAVDHYQKLGLQTSYHDETYAFANRDGTLTIHLALQAGGHRGPGSLYIHAADADQVASEWRLAGLEVAEPEDYDYGKRVGSHSDPDGNLIRFGSPLPGPDPD